MTSRSRHPREGLPPQYRGPAGRAAAIPSRAVLLGRSRPCVMGGTHGDVEGAADLMQRRLANGPPA